MALHRDHETIGYHVGDFFSPAGVIRAGMVTRHRVGLPPGPQPAALGALGIDALQNADVM
jgi:homogentisate 1,2-dioxygenase